MRVINGEAATYYTQRNNKVSPARACGVTSAVNAVVALGYPMPAGEGQPEDRLMEFIRADPICLEMFGKKNKASPINEWQDILAVGLSRWMGVPDLAMFNERATEEELFHWIKNGGAALITGEFPTMSGATLHHTVALIGLETFGGDDFKALLRWYIRDSWGDHRTLYSSQDGRLIDLRRDEFLDRLKKTKGPNKWAILIRARS